MSWVAKCLFFQSVKMSWRHNIWGGKMSQQHNVLVAKCLACNLQSGATGPPMSEALIKNIKRRQFETD